MIGKALLITEDPITVREIMSHTAGIHKGHRKENTASLVADAGNLAKLPLDFEPGTNYVYSQGPLIGGAIVEVVSGIPYPDFVKQRILDPLGMKDTTFWPSAELAPRLALTAEPDPATHKLKNINHNPDFVNNPAKRGTFRPGFSCSATCRRSRNMPTVLPSPRAASTRLPLIG